MIDFQGCSWLSSNLQGLTPSAKGFLLILGENAIQYKSVNGWVGDEAYPRKLTICLKGLYPEDA